MEVIEQVNPSEQRIMLGVFWKRTGQEWEM